MGLDNFIDDYEPSEEDGDDGDEEDEPDPMDRREYSGDKELLDITVDEVKEVLDSTDYDFSRESHPVNGKVFSIESNNGKFILYVATSWEHRNADCITVSVSESFDKYDVIDPRLVFPTEGWRDRLVGTIEDVLASKDEIQYCDMCGSVKIYRKTNAGNKKIHGCSNYPDCSNKEIANKQ